MQNTYHKEHKCMLNTVKDTQGCRLKRSTTRIKSHKLYFQRTPLNLKDRRRPPLIQQPQPTIGTDVHSKRHELEKKRSRNTLSRFNDTKISVQLFSNIWSFFNGPLCYIAFPLSKAKLWNHKRQYKLFTPRTELWMSGSWKSALSISKICCQVLMTETVKVWPLTP